MEFKSLKSTKGKVITCSENFKKIYFLKSLLTEYIPYELGFLRIAILIDIGFNMLTTSSLSYSQECLKMWINWILFIICYLDKSQKWYVHTKKKWFLLLSYNCFTKVGSSCRELIKNEVFNVGEKNCIFDLPIRDIYQNVLFRMKITNKVYWYMTWEGRELRSEWIEECVCLFTWVIDLVLKKSYNI